MGHGYVRANYGDNCFFRDSSTKRFWRAHGDVTIFNNYFGGGCNNVHTCGGSFGSWFGYGLAMNLSSLVMGGLNSLGGWIGGGLGLGNWGLGGSYMPTGGSLIDRWSTNHAYDHPGKRVSSKTKTVKVKDTVEKLNTDYPKAIEFTEKIKKLNDAKKAGTLTQAQIDTLRAEIDTAKATKADNIDTNNDDKMFDRLIALLPELETNTVVTGKGSSAGDVKTVQEELAKINTLDDLLAKLPEVDYANLSEADKQAYKDKFRTLIDGIPDFDINKGLELLKANNNLPTDLKDILENKTYGGYTNYRGEELANGVVIKAVDTGAPRDVNSISGPSTIDKTNNTITLHDDKIGDVTYKFIQTNDYGEHIYQSQRGKQQFYILQKASDGTYELRQYKHTDPTGWNVADQEVTA